MKNVPLQDLHHQLEELLDSGQYAAGFALGRHILQHYPRHLATYRLLGLAALEAGLEEDSVDLLQRALSADPEDGDMWAALHEAAAHLDLHPDAEVAGAYAHDLIAPEKGVSAIARGHAAARENAWEWAYDEYRKGYLDQPQRMDAALGLLSALFKLEQWQSSLVVARHVLDELPYSLKALWLALLSAKKLGRNDLPLRKWFQRTRSIDPENTYIHRWLDTAATSSFRSSVATIPDWDSSGSWQYNLKIE